MKIKTAVVFVKFNDNSVGETLNEVAAVLKQAGVEVLLKQTTFADSDSLGRQKTKDSYPADIDLAIVVGGDGTMLHVAKMMVHSQTPTVGVNLGRLGFLTDIAAYELQQSIGSIINGDYHIENRILLETTVLRDGEKLITDISLNDTVISKGDIGRLIECDIAVDGKFVNHTRSDGLIIATPTGSTAYALSAGGPIVYPTVPAICIVPICPHTLSNRPIIISSDNIIEISLPVMPETHANLALDGIIIKQLTGNEVIRIQTADQYFRLIRLNAHSYFENLRAKLGWQQ